MQLRHRFSLTKCFDQDIGSKNIRYNVKLRFAVFEHKRKKVFTANFGRGSEAVIPDHRDKKFFAAFNLGILELRDERFHGFEGARAGELLDDGLVGVVIMEKVGVEFAGVKEDLEGKIEVLLAVDHGDEAFGMEALGPGFNRGCDGVVLEEWGGRIYGGKVNAGERSEGGVSMEESDQQSAMQFSTMHHCLEK
ncbi:hypothetical protein V6N13_028104 [Hibiscus sabdariffa]|uniref:Uncharacterized protein n=1 Tax=Hibiscus sabdariffa TaxID=183260 RepID=A0ABR2B114_9ROSI